MGTLALASIDGGCHFYAAPTHIGQGVVERGGQNFVFAGPSRAHHRQGLQGVAAGSWIGKALLERDHAVGLTKQDQ